MLPRHLLVLFNIYLRKSCQLVMLPSTDILIKLLKYHSWTRITEIHMNIVKSKYVSRKCVLVGLLQCVVCHNHFVIKINGNG